ncbi:hypothetical protein [Actinospica robiniae]|uniref:hypothetical protein n=1 Tax=Actinospica robiniae TaxID=304901 RepID=UPI00040A852D|nr:hypothetical protein [Actinospica robiniae]
MRRQHDYDLPINLAENAAYVLGVVATAVLPIVPRTRALGTSFALLALVVALLAARRAPAAA